MNRCHVRPERCLRRRPASSSLRNARLALLAGLLCTPASFAQTTSGNWFSDLLNHAGDAMRGQPAPGVNPALQQQFGIETQIPPELAPLFAKGTVNGAELIGTLREIQRLAGERRAALQLATLVGAADQSMQAITAGNFDVLSYLQDRAIQAAFSLAGQVAANAATDALDEHMHAMLDDPNALAAETVTLPSPVGLQARQARRTVVMAALVVGARVSQKMLEHAQKDVESLRKDYGSLIEQREKAATLLFAAIAERNKLQGGAATGALRESLSDEDLKFIDQDLGKLGVRDFAKDMSAQNLALNYLRKTQPAAFASYRTQADDVVLRTKAYLRTMTGIAAFGALMANFTQNVGDMARDKRLIEFIKAMPLIFDFLRAAAPLMTVTVQTATAGISLGTENTMLGNLFSRKRNFVYAQGDKSTEESSAKDVFAELAHNGEAIGLFKGALFRSDGPGLLQRVGECDRGEAGRMLDATTSRDEREEFANHYFDEPAMAEHFSFYAALEAPGPSEREQLLAAQLLANDYRDRATVDAKPISKVQQRVSDKYADWSDAQLMRLIFANKETPARYATLYVGEVRIKPLANADALYAYETSAESCKKLLMAISRPAAAAKTDAKAASKPAAKPAAKPPAKKESK
ncbi:MAG: hypothetical protein JOY60_04275 [Burkholderiaceae bacterium]|nr:hypothetical protein [Burkholderiaceae bacterium]